MRMILAACVIGLTAALGGCSTSQTASEKAGAAAMWIEPSSRDVTSGDTVTFQARTRDTLGKDAKVKWTTTAGKLTTENDGKVARVKFDEPGTYSVRATLQVNGQDIQTDMVEVRVKPLK